MENVKIVQSTGMTFLSDRWGGVLGDVDALNDVAAVERLAGTVGRCDEMGFAVRDADNQYGIRFEYEFSWRASDDDDIVSCSWGDLNDDDILASVTNWVERVNAATEKYGFADGVITTNEDEIFSGRIGACWFVPEDGCGAAVDFLADVGRVDAPHGSL